MDPATITLIASLLLKYGPGVAQAVVELFHKKEVTREDWLVVFAKAEKPYEAFDPTLDAAVARSAAVGQPQIVRSATDTTKPS